MPFSSTQGVVLQKPCKPGETINRKFCRDLVFSEVKYFYKKAQLNAGMRGIKLLHDNAPVHKMHLVQEYLSKENTETLQLPAHLPGLTVCDFFLLPHLKKCLIGRILKSWSALKTAVFQCLACLLRRHIDEHSYNGFGEQ